MKKIGGYFPYEALLPEKNNFLEGLCPDTGDLRYLMSGRCAIYYALEDYKNTDMRRIAYVPIYTCETVLAPFHKAGYTLLFYDFDRNMNPVFDPAVLDQISVISICGYYGFSSYNREFVAECSRRGIGIIEDTTHSIFSSDGIDPHCDYIVGSLRKWIGVAAGGFAIDVYKRQQLYFAEFLDEICNIICCCLKHFLPPFNCCSLRMIRSDPSIICDIWCGS